LGPPVVNGKLALLMCYHVFSRIVPVRCGTACFVSSWGNRRQRVRHRGTARRVARAPGLEHGIPFADMESRARTDVSAGGDAQSAAALHVHAGSQKMCVCGTLGYRRCSCAIPSLPADAVAAISRQPTTV
jgi:hypothetical protein